MRKRAWDILRDEFTRLEESDGLLDAVCKLKKGIAVSTDNSVGLVFAKSGEFLGVVTMWSIMKKLEARVFNEDVLNRLDDTDWDKAFGRACRACADVGMDDLVQEKYPVVKPGDPLVVVINELLDSRSDWVVVRESGKALGLIYKGDVYKEITSDVMERID